MSKIKRLEEQSDRISQDEKTEKFKFRDKKFRRLSKRAKKKPNYVLVQYLRNNRTIDFHLCKVISGNIIVIDNKGHELNPKYTWIRGKNIWYIIREKDTKPVSVSDKVTGWKTDDHPVLMKMVLGAIQKKEMSRDQKRIIQIIIIIAVLAFIGYIFFGGG